jgi:F-type H+-transporting ATPase subunit beta
MQNQTTRSNPTASPTSNIGTLLSVRGSVVDARFPQRLPAYLNRLNAGENGKVIVEVVAHINAEVVRGIALTSTSGLARGSPVIDLEHS